LADIIIFPNNKPKITPEEYSLLDLHIVKNGEILGLLIQGFNCEADVEAFIQMLDGRFLRTE